MDQDFTPAVDPEIFAIRPDYCALSIVAEGIRNTECQPASHALVETVDAPRAWPAWGDAHLEAWREAYRAFGAKPQRTRPSVEALARRVQSEGRLPAINAVVDLYNALSVRFAIPIGGENIAAYSGPPVLKRATGEEPFDTVSDGVPCQEIVPAGEVVWADARGVTCRRWNWRQGLRTRIDLQTTRMWFVLERLEPMPLTALHHAGQMLAAALAESNPGAAISSQLIDRQGVTRCTVTAGAPTPLRRPAPATG